MIDIIAGVCSAITAVAAVGLLLWKIFLPHIARSVSKTVDEMRAEVVGKVDDIHKQTTVNHHSSTEPTILDRLDDNAQATLRQGEAIVKNVEATKANTTALSAQGQAIAEQGQQIRDLTHLFMQHMEESRQKRREFQDLRSTVQDHLIESATVWAQVRRPGIIPSLFRKA